MGIYSVWVGFGVSDATSAGCATEFSHELRTRETTSSSKSTQATHFGRMGRNTFAERKRSDDVVLHPRLASCSTWLVERVPRPLQQHHIYRVVATARGTHAQCMVSTAERCAIAITWPVRDGAKEMRLQHLEPGLITWLPSPIGSWPGTTSRSGKSYECPGYQGGLDTPHAPFLCLLFLSRRPSISAYLLSIKRR
ncbi:uncharacterized protein K460DRAFT_198687 [Cucurbitaria berberidis CBS 394.84]|uniref:Uncharacterized protein n=1 Tax=Cucurbitaria berberidis CBS 394.84 TaxID=1168544 RepID=A0A9P4G912_9PLEO|nr:uncharacterized protein K460DRAFT_198687 [Cucurbitaria berberidis CBS 394.84]KAF1841107.1 hypothetical protein K460DRAFT_198687 [Cucurbitaria berberidis CBS 394.84]